MNHTVIFCILVVLSIVLCANAIAFIRIVMKVRTNESFDWINGTIITGIWVCIYFLLH